MNDQKENNNNSSLIKPKISQELQREDKCKIYSFESNESKSFTFENGKLLEKNENISITEGDEKGSVTTTTEKHTTSLPGQDKPSTTSKTTTTYNNYDTKTPFNTPNQQYQQIEGENNTGLKQLNKNPNVGNEQYFTSFQKYANNSNKQEPLPSKK